MASLRESRESMRAMHEQAEKRREETLTYLKEMDRRQMELMSAIARRP
jgi:hypothetical protein